MTAEVHADFVTITNSYGRDTYRAVDLLMTEGQLLVSREGDAVAWYSGDFQVRF